jgi:hypothetical protein
MKDSNWDLDLRDGLAGESKVADLLSLDTLEVKTDRRWHETGNIYIETECWIQTSQSWEASGLRVTKATHWAYVLEDCVIIIPTYRLKEVIWERGKPINCNIPPNPSRGYLITPGALLEYAREAHNFEVKEQHQNFLNETYG